MLRNLRQRLCQCLKVFNSAQPAARFGNPRAHAFAKLLRAQPGQRGAHDPSVFNFGNRQISHLIRLSDQPFAQCKARGEIGEIGRGRHHHRIGNAIVFERDRGFGRVFLCGLATDFCIKWSALDARAEGFAAVVLEDASRGIDLDGSLQTARAQMRAAGVTLANAG